MNCSVDFCCICFDNKKHLHRLSDSDGYNITYFIKLTSVVAEMRFNEMNDQRLVCKACCETINSTYEFRQKCLRSKTKLLDYITQLHKVSNVNSAVNTHLTDVNKCVFVKTEVQNDMETMIEKPELFKTVDKDANVKEHSESYLETQIKSEPNPINLRVDETGDNYKEIESVVIKMEIENDNSDEHVEESVDDPLEYPDDVTYNLSQNDKKKSANQGTEDHLHENFNNIIKCRNDIKTELEENSVYLEEYSDDPLMNPDEIKIDIVNNDTELMGGELNVYNTDGQLFRNIKAENQKNGSSELQACSITSKNIKGIVEETPRNSYEELTLLENPYECRVCHKTFNRSSDLTIHMQKHSEEKPYQCNVCKTKFSYSKNLTTHMHIHTGEKTHECEVCKMMFRESSSLTKHMRIHTGEKPHECVICKKMFRQAGTLTKHMLIHTGKRPYECEVCKKTFGQSSTLSRHMLIHTGEKLHECDVCKEKFRLSGSLARHMLIHTGEKPHECYLCRKTFRQSGSLTKHMLTHTRENPHECEVCKKVFRQSGSLVQHMLIHTGEKPYECNVCKMEFRVSSNLTKHLLIHTGEKPFECDVCKKKFRLSSSLSRHILIHKRKIT